MPVLVAPAVVVVAVVVVVVPVALGVASDCGAPDPVQPETAEIRSAHRASAPLLRRDVSDMATPSSRSATSPPSSHPDGPPVRG